MIDITGTDLRKFIAKAYDLSQPQGMGCLHFQDGAIPEEMIDKILDVKSSHCVAGMDYVLGRAVKMSVYKKGGRLLIGDNWYDHNPAQLQILLCAEGVVYNGTYVEAKA
jgi:hypothetical protein